MQSHFVSNSKMKVMKKKNKSTYKHNLNNTWEDKQWYAIHQNTQGKK